MIAPLRLLPPCGLSSSAWAFIMEALRREALEGEGFAGRRGPTPAALLVTLRVKEGPGGALEWGRGLFPEVLRGFRGWASARAGLLRATRYPISSRPHVLLLVDPRSGRLGRWAGVFPGTRKSPWRAFGPGTWGA